jgi:hypothetical protein
MLNVLLCDGELIWQDFKSIEIFARSPGLADAKKSQTHQICATNQITAEKAGVGLSAMG